MGEKEVFEFYFQYEMIKQVWKQAEYTRKLAWATWILAIATILLAIATALVTFHAK